MILEVRTFPTDLEVSQVLVMYLLKLFNSPKREGGKKRPHSASLSNYSPHFLSKSLKKDFPKSLIISLVIIPIIVSLPDSYLAQLRE